MDKKEILQRQITALENCNVAALKEKFSELFGFECGATNAKNLRNRIAYKLQEIYFGGLSDEDKALLTELPIMIRHQTCNFQMLLHDRLPEALGFAGIGKAKHMRSLFIPIINLNLRVKCTVPFLQLPIRSLALTGTAKNSSG